MTQTNESPRGKTRSVVAGTLLMTAAAAIATATVAVPGTGSSATGPQISDVPVNSPLDWGFPDPSARPPVVQLDDDVIRAGDQVFRSWSEYFASDVARRSGARCGYMSSPPLIQGSSPSDCTFSYTNPDQVYDPSVALYHIPVVVHVIRNTSGSQGNISAAMVQSQIDILNEDFLALPGSNGSDGTDIQIQFHLAEVDPAGNATTGITYSNNTTWYNDSGSYWNSLAWDTHRYLNIYTNSASGALGYVPNLPQGGIAGSNSDRVVIFWQAFGRNAPIGYPFDKGRTATHEVGHYLGLEHTFNGGCGSSACYNTGDLICDTNRQSSPTSACSGSSCGSSDPIHNYMDYSYDLCMEEFTPEQARRMRCSIENYRPLVYSAGAIVSGACCVPGAPGCTGDLDGNGRVSFADLVQILSAWGDCDGCPPDVDGNGTVGFADLLIVLESWGDCSDQLECAVMSEGGCEASGGVWAGADTECGASPCTP